MHSYVRVFERLTDIEILCVCSAPLITDLTFSRQSEIQLTSDVKQLYIICIPLHNPNIFPRLGYIPYQQSFKSSSKVFSSTLNLKQYSNIISQLGCYLYPALISQLGLTSHKAESPLVFSTINPFAVKTTTWFFTLTQSTQLRRKL